MTLSYQNEEGIKEGVLSCFLENNEGHVAIAFNDPAYTLCDTVIFDENDMSVYVVLHQNSFLVSEVSPEIGEALRRNEEILLTAAHYDGGTLDMVVPLTIAGRA